jgi:ABC-type polysaccharide/polyol phosphate export permease
LRQGWKDVGKVFLLAAILDVVYQLMVHRGVYILELMITAVTLAIVPYILLRGLINRIAKVVLAARLAVKQRSIQKAALCL